MKEIYSLQDLADVIGMSWRWVDNQVREGKIKVVMMGGKRKIHADEMARVIREGVKKSS